MKELIETQGRGLGETLSDQSPDLTWRCGSEHESVTLAVIMESPEQVPESGKQHSLPPSLVS